MSDALLFVGCLAAVVLATRWRMRADLERRDQDARDYWRRSGKPESWWRR